MSLQQWRLFFCIMSFFGQQAFAGWNLSKKNKSILPVATLPNNKQLAQAIKKNDDVIFGEPIEKKIVSLINANYSGQLKDRQLVIDLQIILEALVNQDIESQTKYLIHLHNRVIKPIAKFSGKSAIAICKMFEIFWNKVKKIDASQDEPECFFSERDLYESMVDYSSSWVNVLLKPDVDNLINFLKNMSTFLYAKFAKLANKSVNEEDFSIHDIANIILAITETIINKVEWKTHQADGIFSDLIELFLVSKNYAKFGIIEWDYQQLNLQFSALARFKIFLGRNNSLPKSYFENWYLLVQQGELNFATGVLTSVKDLLSHWLAKSDQKANLSSKKIKVS